MGDHPEDEDDYYEDEMDVRFSAAREWGDGWWAACIVGVACKTHCAGGKQASDGRQVYVF